MNAVTSTAGTNTIPAAAAAAAPRGTARSTSWSAMAMARIPSERRKSTYSSGVARPSENSVWPWRSVATYTASRSVLEVEVVIREWAEGIVVLVALEHVLVIGIPLLIHVVIR